MKYERIERRISPSINDGKDSSYFTRLPSNQRRLSASLMQNISKRYRASQDVKSSYGKKISSSVDTKTRRPDKFVKEKLKKGFQGRSEESNEKLIVLPNIRQQVREGDVKLSPKNQTRKALQRISLKTAIQSQYGNKTDSDMIGRNKNQKGSEGGIGKENYERSKKSQIEKGPNNDVKTDRRYSDQGRFEKRKSPLELRITAIEKKSRDGTQINASVQKMPKTDKVGGSRYPKDPQVGKLQSFGKSVNSKDLLKQKPSGRDIVPLLEDSAIDKGRKNEINDKTQNQLLETPNKAQDTGKPDLRSKRFGIQKQGTQNTKGQHVHTNKIEQTKHLNTQREDLVQIDPPQKRRQFRSVDQVVKSSSNLGRYSTISRKLGRHSCVKPKSTILNRADAIRPCDYLRALMEDREMCFPRVCLPCPPRRPSTPRCRNTCADNPCNPCQASIAQCSC